MAAIYGLVSNRDNRIFYVGQTCRDVEARFHEHYWNPKRIKSRLYKKIDNERNCGYDIYNTVLEYCPIEKKDQRERHWIGGLPNLVNDRLARCWSSLSQEEEDNVEAIRRSRRSGIPNWCGHIGVLYFPQFDAWQVQIQRWSNFYILRGDGGPALMDFWSSPGPFGHPRYHGDWYFSDGVKAVEARDRERERLENGAAELWKGFVWPSDFNVSEAGSGSADEVYYRRDIPLLSYEAEDYCSAPEFIESADLMA